jgi:transposase
MARLFWMSNEAWSVVEQHLLRGKPGRPRVDDRRVISGILHLLKRGCRWRTLATRYDRLARNSLAALALVASVTEWAK